MGMGQLLFGMLQIPADVESELERLRGEYTRMNEGRSAMGWRGRGHWESLPLMVFPILVWLVREVVTMKAHMTGTGARTMIHVLEDCWCGKSHDPETH